MPPRKVCPLARGTGPAVRQWFFSVTDQALSSGVIADLDFEFLHQSRSAPGWSFGEAQLPGFLVRQAGEPYVSLSSLLN